MSISFMHRRLLGSAHFPKLEGQDMPDSVAKGTAPEPVVDRAKDQNRKLPGKIKPKLTTPKEK